MTGPKSLHIMETFFFKVIYFGSNDVSQLSLRLCNPRVCLFISFSLWMLIVGSYPLYMLSHRVDDSSIYKELSRVNTTLTNFMYHLLHESLFRIIGTCSLITKFTYMGELTHLMQALHFPSYSSIFTKNTSSCCSYANHGS